MLFGVRHAPSGQSARVQVAAAADRAIQRKANTATATETEPPRPSGGGTAMPGEVQAKMEGAFGADFSAVQIHTGQRAQALGAVAYTQGSDIQFAPGQYDPHSQQGQELLGHELTHVVQQAEGRVQATAQAKGMDVNTDASLEQEADQMGARAARGETVNTAGTGGNVAHATTPIVQLSSRNAKFSLQNDEELSEAEDDNQEEALVPPITKEQIHELQEGKCEDGNATHLRGLSLLVLTRQTHPSPGARTR